MTGTLRFTKALEFGELPISPDIKIIGATRKGECFIKGKVMDQDLLIPISNALIRLSVKRCSGLETLGYTYSQPDGSYNFSIPREYIDEDDVLLIQAVTVHK